MNKQITILIMGIFLISLASAIVIPAGTSDTFQINTTDTLYYDIVGANTSIDGLNITQDIYENYSNVTILTHLMSEADEFTIIFFNKEKELVEVYPSGGSSSSSIIYKDKIIDHYIEREVHSNETIGIDDPKDEEIVEEKTRSPLVWIFGLVGVGIIIALIISMVKGKNKNEK